jgi:hypothetical protein
MTGLRHWITLCEAASDMLWVHFTDHPMLSFNPKGFHQDPLGLYFFPADHVPKAAMWNEKKYKFVVRLKPDARVLYWADVSDEQIEQLLLATNAKEHFTTSIAQYPPKSRKDLLDRVWEYMRMAYMRSVPAAWTKVLLRWFDAIYDDTGSIHSSEPMQLLVLNPRMLQIVDMQHQKLPVFAAMQKVIKDIAALSAPYGEVEIEGPRRPTRRDYSDNDMQATVRVTRSKENYLTWSIYHRRAEGFRTRIQVSSRYAWPSLNAGFGATYDITTDSYERPFGLDDVKHALHRVFVDPEASRWPAPSEAA